MGHERVGALPHSKKWRDIVDKLADSPGSREDVAAIANAILENVRTRFRKIHSDDGVIAAFQFLVALAKSASAEDINATSISPKIDFEGNPSTLKLIVQLRSWIESQKDSNEYAIIAMKASADAISRWSAKQGQQATLFTSSVDASEIWQRADSGAGFCEVSRLFFSNFTERYLNYFLEREASAEMMNISARDYLAQHLREHIDDVSRFAFETSRITQSFAAGWFNNHARGKDPSKDELKRFLSIAFGKMREEMRREISAHE